MLISLCARVILIVFIVGLLLLIVLLYFECILMEIFV